MHGQVIHRDSQELQAKDITEAQDFAQSSIQAIAADGIGPGAYYAGLDVTQYAATQVRVAPGRYWKAGQAYAKEADSDLGEMAEVIEMSSYLPITQNKAIALAVWGREVETDLQQRHFLDNIVTGAGHFEAVPVRQDWEAVVEVVNGEEASAPVVPAIPPGMLHFATVWLSPAGIDRIEMMESARLPRIDNIEFDLSQLRAWMLSINAQVEALKAAIAALMDAQFDFAKTVEVQAVMIDVARLKERLVIGDTYAQYAADIFDETDESDLAYAGYSARVDNGLLFPTEAIATADLALLSPNDAGVSITNNAVLPAYESERRFGTEGYEGSDTPMSVESVTYEYRTVTVNNWVHAKGWSWNQYTEWWVSKLGARYATPDYRSNKMSVPSYAYHWNHDFATNWSLKPVQVEVLEAGEAETVSGASLAQTFVSPSMWLTKVGLYFTNLDDSGDVTLMVTNCSETGRPIPSEVFATTTVPYGELQAYPNTTRFALPPVYLEGGRRYAFIVISSGAHRLAIVGGKHHTEGSLFTGTSDGFFEGDLSKDLLFDTYAAKFKNPRTVLSLQPISLAGGISDLQMSLKKRLPPSCELEIQYQVGGQWHELSEEGNALSTLPNLLPLRAVFVGTRDLQPNLTLTANAIEASRPKVSLTHFSALRVLGAASSEIHVRVRTHRFDNAIHTLVATLVEPDTTEHSAAVTTISNDPNGSRVHLFEFSLGLAIPEYRVKLAGTRANAAAEPFAVVERIDIAF